MLLNDAASTCEEVEIPAQSTSNWKNSSPYSALGELLYGLESMRKKRGQTSMEAEEEEIQEDGPANVDEIPC